MGDTNHLPPAQRVLRGKAKEKDILERLQKYGLSIVASSDEDDKINKIDAWWDHGEHGLKSVQIKYREGRADLGVALFMPWNEEAFLDNFGTPRDVFLKWDRDVRKPIDYYFCDSTAGLLMASSHLVRSIYLDTLVSLQSYGGFPGKQVNTFCPDFAGVELKRINDAHSGLPKVICYISYDYLSKSGGVVLDI